METKKVRTLDEVQRDKREREREEFKRRMSGDIKDVFDDIFKPLKPPKKVKKKRNWFFGFLKWLGILFLAMLILNFILFNIWAFKKLVESLFGI